MVKLGIFKTIKLQSDCLAGVEAWYTMLLHIEKGSIFSYFLLRALKNLPSSFVQLFDVRRSLQA